MMNWLQYFILFNFLFNLRSFTLHCVLILLFFSRCGWNIT